MQHNKLNVVTDGQHGSTGKGAIATALAHKYRPEVLSTTNLPNAGHTAVNSDGQKFVAKALPSPAILSKWYPDYTPEIIVGASAGFHMDQLVKEINECGVNGRLHIHPRAGVITEEHKLAEQSLETGTKHIASTMQGCGAFLADKIMRHKSLKLARDYEELRPYIPSGSESFTQMLHNLLLTGTILHEGSQGFSLDINHGSHYPACTSRGTTAIQNLADLGLPPRDLGSVIVVIRPYPIRVGNVVEDGVTVGYSGDCYPDNKEITWAEVAEAAGAPPEVMQGELTTVTKRLRRVFSFSIQQVKEAVLSNGATEIALNFANYIDWSCFGTNDYDRLPLKVMDFIHKIEDATRVPVTMVGTGPQINHVCFF